MTVLGAVLVGGQSRRFGSDKAQAILNGETLVDRVVKALWWQVDDLIRVGGSKGVDDRPNGGLGPLGGINAALHHAQEAGFDWVVSVPCDAPLLPHDLVARLRGDGPRFASGMPVIGWWPASLAGRLDDHLARTGDRSMRRWATLIEAAPLDLGPIANVNTPDDLARISGGSVAAPRR